MAGFTSYTLENDEKFKAALKQAGEISTDLRIPFGLIVQDFYKSQAAIFQLKGPGKYPPFKNSIGKYQQQGSARRFVDTSKSRYQRAKIKAVGFDYPLLVRTGALANSLLGPNNRGSVAIVKQLSLIIGTLIKYGIYHQSDEPRRVIPLRKFLFIGPEAPTFATSEQMGRLTRWLGIMEAHVQTKLKKAGLNG